MLAKTLPNEVVQLLLPMTLTLIVSWGNDSSVFAQGAKVPQAWTAVAAMEATMATVETGKRAAEAKEATRVVALATLAIDATTSLKHPEPICLHNA